MNSQYTWTAITDIGVPGISSYLKQQVDYLINKIDQPLTLTSRRALYPIQCRRHTSDFDVFKQIFVNREYSCLDHIDIDSVELIIDCGANIGCSSAYFLSRFPQSRVIAIEPDPENFSMMKQNLKTYGNRVETKQTAIWSKPAELVFSEVTYADGREWTRQVRECQPGESPCMVATDIGTVFKASGYDRISILKIDIEGAEAVVFSTNYQDWLSRVDVLVIELHDNTIFGNASDVFFQAISQENFEISRCEELTVCKRRDNYRSKLPSSSR
jgi:FkbM family methyltransferase